MIEKLVVLGSDWYWEQDSLFRYTRIAAPLDSGRRDFAGYLGRCRWDLENARALTMTWDEHRALLSSRRPFQDFQYVVTTDDGQALYLSVSGEPRFDAAGRFRGYRGTSRDVTGEWAERARLQDAQALLGVAAVLGRFGAWSVDVRTGTTRWTEQTRAIHQIPLSRESGVEQVLRMYAPEYRDVLLQAFQRCVSDGTPYDLELQAFTGSGERVWVRVIGVAMRDADGQVTRVQGAFQDIQRSKLAAEEHRKLAERFRITLDSLTDGFATLDPAWRITYANPAAYAMLGVAPDQVLGRPLWDVFTQLGGTSFEENYRAAMERGEVRRFEAYYPPLAMWIRASAFPSEQGIAISFSDVTAAVGARQALLRQNEELEQRVRERTDQLKRINEELATFTMAVAHDLRAPLAGISGFSRAVSERLAGPDLDAQVAHYLSRIEAGVERMDEQLTALVALSRIGRADIELRPQDLSLLARDAVEALRAASPARRTVVHVQDGLCARGDGRLLRTLLENLLGNAWKFSAGRDPARIEVGRAGDAFFVRDNGAGFDMQHAGDLFAPFRRLHAESEFAGLGVGLASARRVVERHGGRIWAESAPDAGAVFWFTLAPQPGVAP